MASPRKLVFRYSHPFISRYYAPCVSFRNSFPKPISTTTKRFNSEKPILRNSWTPHKNLRAESEHHTRMRKFNEKKNKEEDLLLARQGRLNIAGAIDYISSQHGVGFSGAKLRGPQARLDVIAQSQKFVRIFKELCALRRVNVEDAETSRATIYHFLARRRYVGNSDDRKLVVCADLGSDGLGPVDAVVVESYFRFHRKGYRLVLGGEKWVVKYDGTGNVREERLSENGSV